MPFMMLQLHKTVSASRKGRPSAMDVAFTSRRLKELFSGTNKHDSPFCLIVLEGGDPFEEVSIERKQRLGT